MEFSSFLDYLQLEKNYSQKTIIAYKNDLMSFQDFNHNKFDQKNIKEVNYSQIRSWVVSLVADKISNTSINRKISSLNSYYKFLLKTGDIVEIDVNKRSINMLVDDKTLQKRKLNLVQKKPKAGRGWLWMYSNHVKQANEGCDFDFLETDFGKSAKEPDIF